MIPIGLCSVATLYLIGDGIIRTSRKRVAPSGHEQSVKALFRQGDYVGAYNYCKENPSPLTNVLRVGISLLGDGKQVAEEGMMGELAKENANMQTYISYLSVIGVCTPMIGLLGTVTGMIKAFANLGVGRHRRSIRTFGGDRRSARRDGARSVHRHSGVRRVLLPAQSRGRVRSITSRTSSTALFRKMPYESLAGVHIGDEELYAAIPNWLVQPEGDGTGIDHAAASRRGATPVSCALNRPWQAAAEAATRASRSFRSLR